ncbi:G-protein coupled receptor 26-like [Eucyclogobius newberryi]|uniref:G-protein coupled receptor 26-like n=1 Tax=Eucyclogobius newberryi TaxID=166745 RepID=UPI003B598C7D
MDAVELAACAFMLVIIVVSLVSNILVLVCFLYNPELRAQVPGLFTLNLTVCNVALTVSNMPLTLAGVVSGAQPGGDALCQVLGFLDTFLSTNSMLSMAALSIDRWLAVVFPLRYHSRMRHRDALLVLGYAWTHSASFSAAAACLSLVGYHRLYASCTLVASSRAHEARTRFVAFTVLFHACTFLLSCVVLCVTYLKVLKVARFHCRRIDVITMQTLVLLVDIHPSVRQRCLEEKKRRRQRATKKISTFIGTFMICFAPYVITRVLELFPAVHVPPRWALLSKLLAYSKAACDPFVYSLLRHQYRQTCAHILDRVLRRRALDTARRGPEHRGEGEGRGQSLS